MGAGPRPASRQGRRPRRHRPDNRLLVNAVLCVARTGRTAHGVPVRFGKPNSVLRQFDRWARRGLWALALRRLSEPTWGRSSSTPPSCGPTPAPSGAENRGGQPEQALGRSRGGFGSKLHPAVYARRAPVELHPTAGQEFDAACAGPLLAGRRPGAVSAGKGCDGDRIVQAVRGRGAEVVIPPWGAGRCRATTTGSGTRRATWRSGSSAGSSSTAAWPPVTTSRRRTTWRSSTWPPS
jgi:transposase